RNSGTVGRWAGPIATRRSARPRRMTGTASATARGVRRTTLPISRSSSSTVAIAMTERPRYTWACLLRDAPPVAQPEPEEVPVLVERIVQEVELRGAPVLARVRTLDDPPAHA